VVAHVVNVTFLKEKALELGFHLIGVTPAVRLSEAEYYRQWLAQGFVGEMDYMARNVEKREDPGRLFPSGRSIIVCGLSYHSSLLSKREHNAPVQGHISRYARGDDYHLILKNKLYALLEFIRKESTLPVEAKVCVDTVPLLEKLYGMSAGLGWIGKHGCVINQHYGSWIFLGEILVNLEFEYDSPVLDRCGKCTRCLEACPTGALIAPRILDARRCISYLTIELKTRIPEAFRGAIGNRVFGCDRCQEVCPWNQKAKVPQHPSFVPRKDLDAPDLNWLCSLSPETFSKTFPRSVILRIKLHGLLRNTIVAIGNSGDSGFIPLLRKVDDRSDPVLQEHIAWALQHLPSPH
jgi:epoxyqueuosine reductase